MSSVTLNNLANLINTIKWSKTCDYVALIAPLDIKFGNLIHWGQIDETQKNIDIALKRISVPQYSARYEEVLTAGRWHLARGADAMYQTDMTFRDFNNGTMYRRFLNAFEKTAVNYPSRCYFKIEVFLNNVEKNVLIMGTHEALISDVSILDLSQDNAEIMEFNVSFKFNRPIHDNKDIVNINFAKTGSKTGQEAVLSKASTMFSDMLKNGLSKAQGAVIGKLENLVKGW